MKVQNVFTNKTAEFKEDLDKRIWALIEEPKKITSERKTLTIQDFLKVREFKEKLRNSYQEYCQ